MELATRISAAVRKDGRRVAVAESLTSGSLSCHLGAAEAASEWFLGGVVAYHSAVKFTLLGVDRGPVITARCALQMAQGVVKLTGADIAVAVTGAGGPGPEEGKPSGTVFIGLYSAAGTRVEEFHFHAGPSHVVHETTFHALQMLDAAVRGAPGPSPRGSDRQQT